MVSLPQVSQKIKTGQKSVLLALLIVLTGSLAFGLGRLSAVSSSQKVLTFVNNTHSDIVNDGNLAPVLGVGEQVASPALGTGKYVGSKTSDKYHLPWCGGAKRIKEENRVWFASKAEAEAAGYQPAGNCPGI